MGFDSSSFLIGKVSGGGGGGGGGTPKLYLVRAKELKAVVTALGITGKAPIVDADASAITLPNMVVRYSNSSASQFVIEDEGWGYNRGSAGTGSMVFLPKIEPGVYTKLCGQFWMWNTASDCEIKMGIANALSFTNGDFNMNLKSLKVADSSTPLSTQLDAEIDISDVDEAFYVGFYTKLASSNVINIWLE